MRKLINKDTIAGYLYETDLQEKVTKETSKHPGTSYITGSISIATNDECTNIVPVYFRYVAPTFPSGKINRNYDILKDMINGQYKTIMKDGREEATILSVSSALALNEWYTDRNGTTELVSVKRADGGFINIERELPEKEELRNKFVCDIVITNFRTIEADEERNQPEKGIIKGAIFDYSGAVLPVEFTVVHPEAIAYFESSDISNRTPMFTQVWGQQVSEVIKRELRQESAFGADLVREVTSTRKDFIITGANKEPYDFDDEMAEMLSEAISKRDTYLATLKQQSVAKKENTPVTADTAEYHF